MTPTRCDHGFLPGACEADGCDHARQVSTRWRGALSSLSVGQEFERVRALRRIERNAIAANRRKVERRHAARLRMEASEL